MPAPEYTTQQHTHTRSSSTILQRNGRHASEKSLRLFHLTHFVRIPLYSFAFNQKERKLVHLKVFPVIFLALQHLDYFLAEFPCHAQARSLTSIRRGSAVVVLMNFSAFSVIVLCIWQTTGVFLRRVFIFFFFSVVLLKSKIMWKNVNEEKN